MNDTEPTYGDAPAEETGQTAPTDPVPGTLFETKPTVKPAAIRLGIILFVGLLLIFVLTSDPQLLGNAETTNVALLVIQLLVFIAVVRVVITVVVLLRTTYVVTPKMVRREYDLLFRHHRREVPHERIRSVQFDQTPLENFLGFGTVAVNQGLGELRMPNLRDPYEMIETVREQVESAPETRVGP